MGRLTSSGKRRLLRVLALSAVAVAAIATLALAAGPGGWDHLGDRGTPGSESLNLVASALEVTPGALYVGGKFTDAGGIANADRIATWNGSNWNAVSSSTEQITNGEVFAIAVAGGKVYAGGVFTNAGSSGADNLAVWDGATWEPFCTVPNQKIGNVRALQVVGSTLYVGGDFQDGAGIATADYLLACDLRLRHAASHHLDPAHPFSGPVKALTATSDGTLYAGGRFANLENIAAADNVAYLPPGGTGTPMGSSGGGPTCGCALDAYVRGLATNGTDVFVGTEGSNVAGIAQADHVAKWDGSGWSAIGSNTAGTNGWFPAATNIYDLASVGSNVFATGTFQNANGDARADNIAWFDGTKWQPVGSNGAGNGPWVGEGSRPRARRTAALCRRELHERRRRPPGAVRRLVRLAQIIAYPTPTVTPGPSPVPTPTVTPPARHPARHHAAQDVAARGRSSITRSARRRSGSPPARRARSSSASSTRRSTSPARRRRSTRSSSPASTCSASRRATAPATSTGRRSSSGSGSSGGSARPQADFQIPNTTPCGSAA